MSPSIKIFLLFIFATLIINSQQQCVPKGGDCSSDISVSSCCQDKETLFCLDWGNNKKQCHNCKPKGKPCYPGTLQNDFCCNKCDSVKKVCT
ncbi:unnamed protein product [Meloidogyne enterolobii]|uniref:Uncharacterized protein n=2 Tax=Meloidogyne enterolobii TaxID=390850 RepID=A0ACB0ZGN7_MELEN|nr:unnamed protein product [Meloidogyne enterolobii]